MHDQRFTGAIGEDYRLFPLAVPHYDAFQDVVRTEVAEFGHSLSPISTIRGVELGCGNGFTTSRLVDADRRIEVLAVDSDPAMLQQACRALLTNWPEVHFFLDDAESLLHELGDSEFHFVASACMLHNLPAEQRRRIVRAAARVLKPGGLFINADKLAVKDSAEHRQMLENQIQAFAVYTEHGRPDLTAAWTQHYREDDTFRFTEAEQHALLRESGFHDIRTVYRKGMEAVVTAYR